MYFDLFCFFYLKVVVCLSRNKQSTITIIKEVCLQSTFKLILLIYELIASCFLEYKYLQWTLALQIQQRIVL
jgi:hypothetical protein